MADAIDFCRHRRASPVARRHPILAAGLISHIFFDNDGVLVDTEHLYMEASRSVLAERGIDLSESDYVELFMRQNRGLLHYGHVHGWAADDVRDLRARRNILYATMLEREPLVCPGVVETLEALHGRVRMAIVTSSRRDHFDIIHARTGLLRYFDFVLTDGDYAVSKPDPAPYLAALVRADADPQACLVIEDSERGLASARAAGLRCLIVPSRLTHGQRFDGAWRVMDDVRDVPRLIETL
jgi:HAD superfamily hydrolase (TIGR01509 family)